jgi:arylsulfatase A-like enzyme
MGPGISPGATIDHIVSNVDFAPTFLQSANIAIPSYMQEASFTPMLEGTASPQDEWEVAYHRYWMHREAIHNSYVSIPYSILK